MSPNSNALQSANHSSRHRGDDEGEEAGSRVFLEARPSFRAVSCFLGHGSNVSAYSHGFGLALVTKIRI